jgi:hypothetical protein
VVKECKDSSLFKRGGRGRERERKKERKRKLKCLP